MVVTDMMSMMMMSMMMARNDVSVVGCVDRLVKWCMTSWLINRIMTNRNNGGDLMCLSNRIMSGCVGRISCSRDRSGRSRRSVRRRRRCSMINSRTIIRIRMSSISRFDIPNRSRCSSRINGSGRIIRSCIIISNTSHSDRSIRGISCHIVSIMIRSCCGSRIVGNRRCMCSVK